MDDVFAFCRLAKRQESAVGPRLGFYCDAASGEEAASEADAVKEEEANSHDDGKDCPHDHQAETSRRH